MTTTIFGAIAWARYDIARQPRRHAPLPLPSASTFIGLEPLEQRTLLSATTTSLATSAPTASTPTAIAVQPLAADDLTITGESIVIDSTMATQIVNALKAGRNVNVTATNGDLTVSAKIGMANVRGTPSLTLSAANSLSVDKAISQTGTGALSLVLQCSQNDSAIETNGFLDLGGSLTVRGPLSGGLGYGQYFQRASAAIDGTYTVNVGQYKQAIASNVSVGGNAHISAREDIEDDAYSFIESAVVLSGRLDARRIDINSGVGSVDIQGAVVANAKLPVDSALELPFHTFDLLPDAAIDISAYFGLTVSGTIETRSGAVFVSTSNVAVQLIDQANIMVNRGYFFVSTEVFDMGPNTQVVAVDGDIVIGAAIFRSTLEGDVAARGSRNADIMIVANGIGADLQILPHASFMTSGGNVSIDAGVIVLDGAVNTNGGDLVMNAENGLISVTGTLITGGVRNERGGNIRIVSQGGKIAISKLIQTNGGNVDIIITNNGDANASSTVDIDPNNPFPALRVTLDDRKSASMIVNGLIDTRYRGDDPREQEEGGGKVSILIGRASFELSRSGQILTGGADVTIDAQGAYQRVQEALHTNSDGKPDDYIDRGIDFFGGNLQLDGTINTLRFNGAARDGNLNIPTEGTRVFIGDAAKLLTASGTFALSAAVATSAGQLDRFGEATLRGAATTGSTDITTEKTLLLGLNLNSTDATVIAPIVRIEKDSTLKSRIGDLRIGAPVIGVTTAGGKNKSKTKARFARINRGLRAATDRGTTLEANAAGELFLGGSVTNLKDITIVSKKGVVRLADGLELSKTVIIQAAKTLTIDAHTMHMTTEDGIKLNSLDNEIIAMQPLNLFAPANIIVNASASKLDLVSVVTAGGVDVQVKQLRVYRGIYANDSVVLGLSSAAGIKGKQFTVGSHSGLPHVTAKRKKATRKAKGKARYTLLADPVNANEFRKAEPVFDFGDGPIVIMP